MTLRACSVTSVVSDSLQWWCWRRLESPLDSKEIKPVHPKGNQSWIFIGRTDAEAEAPILWPQDAKTWLTGEAPDAGKDWRQEEKGTTEVEMVGWHHRLNGHEFEQTPRDGEGQGSLQCVGSQRVNHDLATEHQQHLLSTLLYARHCAKQITQVSSSEPQNSSMSYVLLLFPFFRWAIRGTEKIK